MSKKESSKEVRKRADTLTRNVEEKDVLIRELQASITRQAEECEEVKQREAKIKRDLQEKVQLIEIQCKMYQEDFETERREREELREKLDEAKAQILSLERSLHEEKQRQPCNRQPSAIITAEELHELEEENKRMKMQINNYSIENDKLSKALQLVKNRCETLNEQIKEQSIIPSDVRGRSSTCLPNTDYYRHHQVSHDYTDNDMPVPDERPFLTLPMSESYPPAMSIDQMQSALGLQQHQEMQQQQLNNSNRMGRYQDEQQCIDKSSTFPSGTSCSYDQFEVSLDIIGNDDGCNIPDGGQRHRVFTQQLSESYPPVMSADEMQRWAQQRQ